MSKSKAAKIVKMHLEIERLQKGLALSPTARNLTFGLDDNGKSVLNNAPAPTQAERQLFEAAYAQLHRCTPQGGWSDRSSLSGHYEEVDTQDAWILWNAAIATRQAPECRMDATLLNFCEHKWELQPATTSKAIMERCQSCFIVREVATAYGAQQ